MPTFTVWTYDVWGNPKDGFNVNDRSKQGTIELPSDRPNNWDLSDKEIIAALKQAGHINKFCHYKSFSIEGEYEYTLYVSYETRKLGSYPLLELERDDD